MGAHALSGRASLLYFAHNEHNPQLVTRVWLKASHLISQMIFAKRVCPQGSGGPLAMVLLTAGRHSGGVERNCPINGCAEAVGGAAFTQ